MPLNIKRWLIKTQLKTHIMDLQDQLKTFSQITNH
jgi:hypothetical protein